MKSILKSNVSFLLPYFFFLLLGAALLFIYPKADLHLLFNTYHNYFFDVFFYYVTNFGDGLMTVLVVIILLVVNYRYALLVAVSNILASEFTQLLKHTVFEDSLRPKKFFEVVHDLYFVPGVENYSYHSFPSGHSTSAFALYFALALIVKDKFMKGAFFTIALLVGYSRVYLSQHFFGDIYAGSLIGVIITLITYWAIQKINAPWIDRSLTSSFK